MTVYSGQNINFDDTPIEVPNVKGLNITNEGTFEKQDAPVTRPEHYHKGNIDVIEFLERYFPENKFTVIEGFYIGNIIKYVSRYKEKNGYEDLEKAEDYLNRLMDLEGTK
ncbi:DUF3310 domain-containing protein [Bacillus sp. FJAT-49736]|uniref:DUF3310 domain-containing protein n=1 Tax=Bacillus sp. FJAT-49736 TaxID=2833582 RepID=UPI001BC9AC73|nr:DUF3310 domain-containing protein [Bacillus sp. FJAT-49736]MBS4173493.1 DUF3310 domain-containing protein [Bacillus sp. FJAT-49736]